MLRSGLLLRPVRLVGVLLLRALVPPIIAPERRSEQGSGPSRARHGWE